jgi:hypothetical protein
MTGKGSLLKFGQGISSGPPGHEDRTHALQRHKTDRPIRRDVSLHRIWKADAYIAHILPCSPAWAKGSHVIQIYSSLRVHIHAK